MKTRGGHSSSYRPRMQSSSPVQPSRLLQLSPQPQLLPQALPHLLLPLLTSLLPQSSADMRRGLDLSLPPLLTGRHPGGPRLQRGLGLQVRANPPAHDPRSILNYLRRVHSDIPQDQSPGSIIRRPILHYGPIPGNSDNSGKDLHNEHFYDFPAFVALPELQDSMRLVQRYSLEPFMTLRRFFYPRVVIEFYQIMTSKRDPNPTTLHFFIDGREGILWATDIAAMFNLPVVLANSLEYRQWPHPSPREMVCILARDTSVEPILLRRQLPPVILLTDHVLRSNFFPVQHLVQR